MDSKQFRQILDRASHQFDPVVQAMVATGGAVQSATAFEQFDIALAIFQKELKDQGVDMPDKQLVVHTATAFAKAAKRFYMPDGKLDRTKEAHWEAVRKELFDQLHADHEAATAKTRDVLMNMLGCSPGIISI